MADTARSLMTADDFLVWCLDKEARYELVDGIPLEMMTEASNAHDRIVVNVIASLHAQLRGTPCRPTTADIAVRTRHRSVRRPDVMVTCDPPAAETYEATAPKLIVEVLSPSNVGLGWQRKLDEYRRREGLTYLLLIDPACIGATLYTRTGDRWDSTDADTLADVLDLPAVGCRLVMADIYDGCGLEAPTNPGE